MRPPLTKRQEEVLNYFIKFQEVHKVRTPTVREVGSGMVNGEQVISSRKGTSGVYFSIKHLVSKGYLKEHLYRSVPYWVVANE